MIAAVLGSLVREPRRRDLTWWSLGLVAGVVGQIVLGGISVLVDLHPLAVQGHLLLSMVLVATATVLVRRAGAPDGVDATTPSRPPPELVALPGGGDVTSLSFTGTFVTGAGPHAGDEDVRRFDVPHPDRRPHPRHDGDGDDRHRLGARRWRIQRPPSRRRGDDAGVTIWLFVAALQATVGYVQYFNDVPELLVGMHVAGAAALTVATTQVVLEPVAQPTVTTLGAIRLRTSSRATLDGRPSTE